MTDSDYEGDAYPDGRRYSPKAAKRIRGGKKALVALAGMAAIGAGVLFFVTEAIPAKDQLAPQIGALSPTGSAAPSPSPTPTTRKRHPAHPATPKASTSTPVKSAVAPQRSPIPGTSPSLTLAQRVVIARPAAAGVAVPSALPPQFGITAVPPNSTTVTDTGSIKRDGTTMRLVSALGDLTGQRELAWVADAGTPIGDAFCSQNFHYSAPVPPGENPYLMICWRVSPERSVVAISVDRAGTPSAQAGVAAIDRQWAHLSPAPLPSF